MGNDQSRGTSSQTTEVPKVLNYYELLQIDEEATFDEIKVSKRARVQAGADTNSDPIVNLLSVAMSAARSIPDYPACESPR
jgi:hypothetical protein